MRMQENVRAFIVDSFLFGEDAGLQDDSSFISEGFLDSTGIMQLVAFLEETYSVRIKDEELIPENLDSINKVTAFIARRGSSEG